MRYDHDQPANIPRILAALPTGPAPGAPMTTRKTCDICGGTITNVDVTAIELVDYGIGIINFGDDDRSQWDLCSWQCAHQLTIQQTQGDLGTTTQP